MMSKKCKYAIKALMVLGENYGKGNTLTSHIAEQHHIPKKFLEQILLELKRAGYLGSKQGYGGGYYLKKTPSDITVADIYRLFDGNIALVPCVSLLRYEKCDDCQDELSCKLKREFTLIREQTRIVMTNTTITSFLE